MILEKDEKVYEYKKLLKIQPKNPNIKRKITKRPLHTKIPPGPQTKKNIK